MKHVSGTSLLPILLVNFIGTMSYSIILPFLIVLVLGFGGNELTYGILGATYSFFQLIGAPVLGRWSDRYGRKKILLLSQAGTFIGWGIFLVALFLPQERAGDHNIIAFSLPLALLFLARALDGITGGNISVANAYLADITPKADRKRAFGRMSAAGNVGLVIGPALAGLLGATALGHKLPVLLAMAVSAWAILMIAFGLKDIPPEEVTAPLEEDRTNKLLGQEHKECYRVGRQPHSLAAMVRLPFVGYMLLLYFLIFLAFNFFYIAFPVYVAGALRWSTFQIGLFFSVLSGALVLVQGPVLTALSKHVSGARLVMGGCLLLALGFALFRSENTVILYTGLLLFALGNGVMWPSFLALLSNTTDDRYQGAIQGLAGSAGSFASIIGLIAGAFIYRAIGTNTFLLATGLMVVIAVAGLRLGALEGQE